MNDYELHNLRNLPRGIVPDYILQGVNGAPDAETYCRYYVMGLFDLYSGNKEKVKQRLAADREIFERLGMLEMLNKEYKRQIDKNHIHDPERLKAFAVWLWQHQQKEKAANILVCGVLGENNGDIKAAKKQLLAFKQKIEEHGLQEYVKRCWRHHLSRKPGTAL